MAASTLHSVRLQGILFVSLALFLLSIWNIVALFSAAPSDSQCVRELEPWSPAYEAVTYTWRTFEEVEFAIKSPFTEPPSSDVETAWNSLFPEHAIPVPVSELDYIRQDMSDLPSNFGDENQTARGIPEVFLQLKCLNTLRQHTHRRSYDFSGLPAFSGNELAVMEEADACLDRLRQAFMCWADTTPILKEIVPNVGTNYDMKTLHYCRNFDAILSWTEQHGDKDVQLTDIW